MQEGVIIEVAAHVTDILDAGSRWRVAQVDGPVVRLTRVGKRGQALTSKHKINTHRVSVEEIEWLKSRGHVKLVTS